VRAFRAIALGGTIISIVASHRFNALRAPRRARASLTHRDRAAGCAAFEQFDSLSFLRAVLIALLLNV